ncbi:MAG: zinc ribbon domain-containing protein [Treponema sp.]|jgi:putative FmdB family regulatory protein|nr:zinc ribbon domain-containing protein [Treponema sp.]
MPTYEYECKSCGHTFDVFQNMSDEPLKVCPECGKELRRLIGGGTGVIFKGSGFYVTDKNKSSGGASSKAKKDAPASDASGKAADKPAPDKPAAGAAKGAEAAPKPKTETGKA